MHFSLQCSPAASGLVSGQVGGQVVRKSFPCCNSETMRYKKMILGRNMEWGCKCLVPWCDIDITFDLEDVPLTLSFAGYKL